MSVKRSFDTHLIPGLLRCSRNPGIMNIYSKQEPKHMNYFNEPTEKTGYLEQDFRLFHIKDQTKREFSYHYHDFHKVIIFLSGKAAYHIEGKSYYLKP